MREIRGKFTFFVPVHVPSRIALYSAQIKSQQDKKALQLAKDEVYTKGFYSGVMCIGPFKGTPVKDAKNLIRDQLIADGLACHYWEPKDPVVSRSGDQCVVANVDQWYWKQLLSSCIAVTRVTHTT